MCKSNNQESDTHTPMKAKSIWDVRTVEELCRYVFKTIPSPSQLFAFLFSLRAESSEVIESKFNRLLPLFVYERNLRIIRHTGIGSCTWFEGDPVQAAVFLKGRARKVLLQNPWLMARVVTYKGQDHLAFNVDDQFDIEQALEDSFFREVECPLDPNSSVEAISTYALQRKMISNDPKARPGWRVTLLTDKKLGDHFGVLFSLCHQVGDGQTFYRIYRMLVDPNEKIEALDPRRDIDTVKVRTEILGEGSDAAQDNLATVWHFGFFRYFHLCPRRIKCQNFIIDLEKIAEVKKKVDPERDGVKFVSTNDIIASWYSMNNKSAFTRMALNFRGRSPGLGHDLCANFQGFIFLTTPRETHSPAAVRKVVNQINRPASAFPSGWEILTRGRHSVITNWTSFSGVGKLEPPKCKEMRHLPLMCNPHGQPSGGYAILHRFCEGKIAVCSESAPGREPVAIPDFGQPIPTHSFR